MDEQSTNSQMRYNQQELSHIKSLFKGNNELLTVLRKVFLQAELSEEDTNAIKVLQTPEAKALMSKTYFPEIDLDAPFGQIIDLWLTVDNSEKSPEEATRALLVRQRLMELIQSGLARLEDSKVTEEIIDYKPDFLSSDDERYIAFTSRNALISHTEIQLIQLSILANRKEETAEELSARLAKDSVK